MEMESVNKMLETKTALNCFIIGIGNAGNQLVNVAYNYDFDVYAINTSKKDMDDSIINKQIRGFVVGNEARGAGKHRRTAKELFKVNGRELFEDTPTFIDSCNKADVIIVSGSTAGGSGSGLAPVFLRFLKRLYPNKIVIYYGILPRLTESPKAQENSTVCLAEIQQLDIPYMLADLDFYKGISNDVAYTKVMEHVINAIQVINCKFINKSSFGMIDENDMRTVIAEPGYMSIYNLDKITQQQVDQKSLQSMMIAKIKSSPAVEIMRDGIIQHMAAIINMPEEMTDSLKAGDYTELTEYIGKPYAVFENYAITNTATGQLIIILSGQTAPFNRISMMEEIVMEEIVKEHIEIKAKKKNYNLMEMIGNRRKLDRDLLAFIKASSKYVRSVESFSKKNQKILNGLQSEFFGTDFSSDRAFKERYSCKCGKYLGKAYNGFICENCDTKVEYKDIDLRKTGWIILDNPSSYISKSDDEKKKEIDDLFNTLD